MMPGLFDDYVRIQYHSKVDALVAAKQYQTMAHIFINYSQTLFEVACTLHSSYTTPAAQHHRLLSPAMQSSELKFLTEILEGNSKQANCEVGKSLLQILALVSTHILRFGLPSPWAWKICSIAVVCPADSICFWRQPSQPKAIITSAAPIGVRTDSSANRSSGQSKNVRSITRHWAPIFIYWQLRMTLRAAAGSSTRGSSTPKCAQR